MPFIIRVFFFGGATVQLLWPHAQKLRIELHGNNTEKLALTAVATKVSRKSSTLPIPSASIISVLGNRTLHSLDACAASTASSKKTAAKTTDRDISYSSEHSNIIT